MMAGRSDSKFLLKLWKEGGMDFLNRWSRLYTSEGTGWFKVKEINVDPEKLIGYIRIEQSFIAEEYGCSDRPVCDFLAGYLVGVLEEVFHVKFTCEESKCIAKGDPYCEFILDSSNLFG